MIWICTLLRWRLSVVHTLSPWRCMLYPGSAGRLYNGSRLIVWSLLRMRRNCSGPDQRCSGMTRVLKGSHSFTCTPTRYPNRNEPHLPLPSQPQLVLIYRRPRRDGRMSRPWCEVAPAEIRTCNLHIANPALYTTQPLAHQYNTMWCMIR